jgi:hypothetical protein
MVMHDEMSDGMALEPIQQGETLHKTRFWLIVFMSGLFISGITAFPLQNELRLMLSILEAALVRPAAQAVSLILGNLVDPTIWAFR